MTRSSFVSIPVLTRKVLFWPVLLFCIFYGLHILKEWILIAYFTEKYKVSIDFFILAKYMALEFPDFFFEAILPISSIGLLFFTYFRQTDNTWDYLKLKGENPLSLILRFWLIVFLISSCAILLNEFWGKSLRQEADIVYDDDLVRKPWLNPNIIFEGRKFISVGNGKYLYFSSAILDPVDTDKPYLEYPFLWEVHSGIYRTAARAEIKRREIFMKNAHKLAMNDGSSLVNENHSIPLPDTFSNIKKMQTVSLTSLPFREIWNLQKASKVLMQNFLQSLYWYYAILFIVIPLLGFLLSVFMVKSKL